MHRLSAMESKDLLNELDADRASLASRVRTPWWLAAGFGLIAASYVVIPAFDGNSAGVLIAAIVLSIAMLTAYRTLVGVKLGSLGPLPWLLLALGVGGVLGLYVVALALASLNLQPWIALPTVVAFALGVALVMLFTSVARERMRRVG